LVADFGRRERAVGKVDARAQKLAVLGRVNALEPVRPDDEDSLPLAGGMRGSVTFGAISISCFMMKEA
jgi:hypothetical protein